MARSTVLIFAALCLGVACSTSSGPQPVPTHVYSPGEMGLRHALGIPDGAKQVLLLAQTSHLDIDWQKTFSDYYTTWVSTAFLQARQILDTQPKAFYSVAEMAYLQQHLLAHPEEVGPLQADAKRGALRIVGGGMTSPDTLLPEPEMLFRDFLYGIGFSEDTFGITPRAAWLPDSFGHSGAAPDILAAAGFTSVAFSRIDGSPSIGQQVFHPDMQPLPGSTAAVLQSLGSADFNWHGFGGATVLAHFIAGQGLYCEGESIDWSITLPEPGGHLGDFEGGDPSFVEGKLDGYVGANTPYARTPYMLVPVGCDFEPPKTELLQYAAEYDQHRYPQTGVWILAASFEDYAKLLAYWRDSLPDVSGDLAPAFMGFFGTRPAVKRGVRDAARPFFVAEAFATALGAQGAALTASATPQLRLLTRTDHHDFVTGTSDDTVVDAEQMPLLADAQLSGVVTEMQVAGALGSRIPPTAGAVARVLALNTSSATRNDVAEVTVPLAGGVAPAIAKIGGQDVPVEVVGGTQPAGVATLRMALKGLPPWSWTTIDLFPGNAPAPAPQVSLSLLDASGSPATGSAVKRVVLSSSRVTAQLDDDGAGFALTSLVIDGAQAVAGRSLLPVDYADQGGLWRLGNEMAGCTLTHEPAAPGATTVQVLDSSPLQVRVAFVGPTATLEASLAAGEDGLDVAVTTGAAEGTTRTVSLALTAASTDALATSSPAGWTTRPAKHVFDPTFFPAVSWATVGGWAVLLRQSTGVHMDSPGHLELMAVRDARQEQCDITGGTGSDTGTHRIEWRIVRAPGAIDAELASQEFDRPVDLMPAGATQTRSPSLPPQASLASIDGGGVISAIKASERGTPGIIVRARLLAGPAQLHLGPALADKRATLVDLAERDLPGVVPAGDTIALDPTKGGVIAGIRLY